MKDDSIYLFCVWSVLANDEFWGQLEKTNPTHPFTRQPPTGYRSLLRCSQVPQPTCSWKWVGAPVPLQAGIFSFRPSSTKKCKSDMDNGVLIGFVNISGRLMPNHKFFHSLVTALALDFFPPPDCNFFLPPIATFTVQISHDFLSYFSSASLFSVPAEHVMVEKMVNVFIIVGIVGDKL